MWGRVGDLILFSSFGRFCFYFWNIDGSGFSGITVIYYVFSNPPPPPPKFLAPLLVILILVYFYSLEDMAEVDSPPEVTLTVNLVEDARAHLSFLKEIVEHAEMFDERKLRNGK